MSYIFGVRFWEKRSYTWNGKVILREPYSTIESNIMPCGVYKFIELGRNIITQEIKHYFTPLKEIIHNTIPDLTPNGMTKEYFLDNNLWLWYNGLPAMRTIEDAWNRFSGWYWYRCDCEFVLLETKNWGRVHIHNREWYKEKIEWWEYNMIVKMYHVDREIIFSYREPDNLNEILNNCIWENK